MRIDLAELSLGWREGLLFLVAALALYMLFELVRIRRLRKRRENSAVSAQQVIEPSVSGLAPAEPSAPAVPLEEPAWNEPPAHLAQEAFMRGVESDLTQMRDELDALRAEFAALREEMRQETAHLKAGQTISPLYSEAMQMAMNGYNAEVIAERCGIARAEAELVAALAKNQQP